MSQIAEFHLAQAGKDYQHLNLTTAEYIERKMIINHIDRNGGSATWMLAACAKKPANKMRRVLRRMQRQGIVELHEYSSPNNLVWKLQEPRP